MTPIGLNTFHHKFHNNGSLPEPFISLSNIFGQNLVNKMTGYVWDSYARNKTDLINVFTTHSDTKQIERSISQILSDDIASQIPIEAPFSFAQNRDEFASLHSAKAQPPQYDMAFFLISDSRVAWPLEAKLLPSPGTVSRYIDDINNAFLNGTYAPFSDSAAMVGYLRSPDAQKFKENIETKLGKPLTSSKKSKNNHWFSDHKRTLPTAPSKQHDFRCHHLIFELY